MRLQSQTLRGTTILAVMLAAALPAVTLAAEPPAQDQSRTAPESTNKQDDSLAADTMHKMQEMHARMMAAKTPAERAALMREHMAAMQEGMGMMKRVQAQSVECRGPHFGADMGMRMDMMQMMMEMMTDRMSTEDSANPK